MAGLPVKAGLKRTGPHHSIIPGGLWGLAGRYDINDSAVSTLLSLGPSRAQQIWYPKSLHDPTLALSTAGLPSPPHHVVPNAARLRLLLQVAICCHCLMTR